MYKRPDNLVVHNLHPSSRYQPLDKSYHSWWQVVRLNLPKQIHSFNESFSCAKHAQRYKKKKKMRKILNWPTWHESFAPSLKPAQSILSVIRVWPYPVLRHSEFDKIGTVTSCKLAEMSPCSKIKLTKRLVQFIATNTICMIYGIPFVAPQPVAIPWERSIQAINSMANNQCFRKCTYINMRKTLSTSRHTNWLQRICEFHFTVQSKQSWRFRNKMKISKNCINSLFVLAPYQCHYWS